MKLKETFIGLADVITSFGQGIENNFNAILSGRTAYAQISKDRYGEDYPVTCAGFLPESAFRENGIDYVSRSEQIFDLLLKSVITRFSNRITFDAIFLLYKNINTFEFFLNSHKHSSFYELSDQDSVYKVLRKNNISISKDNIHIIENTCATGLTLLTHVSQGISVGLWKNCIVCSIDLFDPLNMFLLNRLGALAPKNDEIEKSLRPFDVNRNGFVKTESGAIAVVSASPKHLDNTEFLKLISFNQSNDAFRLTDGREDAEYIKFSMQKAFAESKLRAEDLAFIKTQGIGTEQNDSSEAKAINEVFYGYNIPVTSLKGHLGHTTDASGLIEALIAGHALKKGIILPTKNCEHLAFNLNIVRENPVATDSTFFLTNSSGFGGNNVSAVFEVI